MNKYRCCLCKKVFEDYGNNPQGALDKNYKMIKFKSNDRCCNECNEKFVIPGRIYLMMNRK